MGLSGWIASYNGLGYAAFMTDERPTLRFGWWNTGIAPPWINSRATAEHRASAAAVMEQLISSEGCSFIGLGEVRRESVLEWVPSTRRHHWAVLQDPSSDRNAFDLALLYDARRFTITSHTWVKDLHAGSPVRAGLIVQLELKDIEAPGSLIVALAHWRADMGDIQQANDLRTRAADLLRDAIAQIYTHSAWQPAILVLGDLNLEPFASQLGASLPSSRSRNVVRAHHLARDDRSSVLLYNAAWRLLGERQPWTGIEAPTLAGTYKLGGDTPSTWRTFDQVLVSGHLLGTSGWTLREDALIVWTNDTVFDADGATPREPFDHLPIVGLLQWLDDINQHGSGNP